MNIQLLSTDPIMNLAAALSFILFLFILFLFMVKIVGIFRRETHSHARAGKPPVSILIPAYNEEHAITSCLAAIVTSSYPKKLYEIIVIDDESTDRTAHLVEQFIADHPTVSVRIIHGMHHGKSAALNLGLTHAVHDLVITIDADVKIAHDTITKLTAPMGNEHVAASNAVAIIHKPQRMIEYFQMIEFTLNNLIRSSFSRVFKNSIWFFGAVACYKKNILTSIGGFKQHTLTEDMDLSLELFSKGYRIITVENAVIATDARPGVAELFTQRMRWYYGALQSLFKHRALLTTHTRRPEILFLFINQWWWTLFAFLFFPLTAYQVYYWFPAQTADAALYLLRWFTLWGPFYVLWHIPDWGLSTLNIFGVLSGLLTLTMSVTALVWFRGEKHPKTLLALALYFPYTILLNAILIAGIGRYAFAKKKYFIN